MAIYLFISLHEGRQSYRRSLQPSKENTQFCKTRDSSLFAIFVKNLPATTMIQTWYPTYPTQIKCLLHLTRQPTVL